MPVVDERLRTLLDYWLELRGDAVVPEATAFDPVRVVPLLAHFWILKRETGTRTWRFALAGEGTITLTGRKLVGEAIEDVFPIQADRFYEVLDEVVSAPAVFHMIGPMYRTDSVSVQIERLVLPMRDGDVIDRIYGATVYRWPPRAFGESASYVCDGRMTTLPVAEFETGRQAAAAPAAGVVSSDARR